MKNLLLIILIIFNNLSFSTAQARLVRKKPVLSSINFNGRYFQETSDEQGPVKIKSTASIPRDAPPKVFKKVRGISLVANNDFSIEFVKKVSSVIDYMFGHGPLIDKRKQRALEFVLEDQKVMQRMVKEGPNLVAGGGPQWASFYDRYQSTDVIFQLQEHQSSEAQIGEVIEHALHTLTMLGFPRLFEESGDWNYERPNSLVSRAMNEAIRNGIYNVDSEYAERKGDDPEGYQRVISQEYGYWLIFTAWDLKKVYKQGESEEWTIDSRNELKIYNPLGWQLFEKSVSKVLTRPEPKNLNKLFPSPSQEELKRLYEQGVISKDQYEEAILDIFGRETLKEIQNDIEKEIFNDDVPPILLPLDGVKSDSTQAIIRKPNQINIKVAQSLNTGSKIFNDLWFMIKGTSSEVFYHTRGRNKILDGDYHGGISDLNKVVEQYPNYPKISFLYTTRGYAKAMLGDGQGSISDSTQAIIRNPKDVNSHRNRGIQKFKLQDYTGTISDMNEVIKLDPNNKTAYMYLGDAKYKSGDIEGACSDWQKASQLGHKLTTKWLSGKGKSICASN